MAEEFDIRSVWQKSKEKASVLPIGITELEKKGKRTTLSWIKLILTIEFWLNIILAPFIIPYMIERGDSIWFIVFYILITVLYLFYYKFLINQIKKFRYDKNVLESLRKVYGYLRFFVLHYKVVIWISMIIGFVYSFTGNENQEVLQKINTPKEWLIMLSISGTLLLIVGLIFQWFIHLIYGRKIKRLKNMIKTLAGEE